MHRQRNNPCLLGQNGYERIQVRHLAGRENQRVDSLSCALGEPGQDQLLDSLGGVKLIGTQFEGVVALGLGLRVYHYGVAHGFGELDGQMAQAADADNSDRGVGLEVCVQQRLVHGWLYQNHVNTP